jgi:carboxyl-terminal processing protease
MVLISLLLACGPKYPVSNSRNVQVETFEVVWHKVHDSYPYEDMGGLDWQAVHDELLPQAEQAKTAGELRPVLWDMLGRLNASHYGILPGEVYDQVFDEPVMGQNATNSGSEQGDALGETGLDVRWVDEQLVVLQVQGPAEQAGIAPGWTLTHIDGSDVSEVAQAAAELSDDAVDVARDVALSARSRLSGGVGSTVELQLVDGQDATQTLTLTRDHGPGVITQLGHLPPIRTQFEHTPLADGVHVLAFDVFMTSINAPLEAAMTQVVAEPAAGVILDLRGNLGGVAGLGSGVAGYFTQDKGSYLATMITREGELRLMVFPRPPAQNYDGPLAVLVDELSFSTAEILADGLQDNGRARVFGSPTSGMALPSTVEKLPNGDRLQYAFADLVGPDGERVEGAGVIPDTVTPPTRDALLQGGDPAIDAATAWILETP